jgi:asparaginyl-tRNA synthetase
MDKIKVVAQKLPKAERLLSGLLRIQSILNTPEKYFDKVESVGGWVRNMRFQANDTLIFIELSDGSCPGNIQVVVQNTLPNFKDLLKQNVAASLRVTGTLVKSPAKGQAIEILVNDPAKHQVEILGENTDPANYPLMGKYPSLELLRGILHLRPRTNIVGSVARARSAMSMATHQFFQELGFLYVHTPIITASDCEGAGEMFQVTTLVPETNEAAKIPVDEKTKLVNYSKDFFGKKASLTVSGQLAIENYACALTNVYNFGPTFRAENSNTIRHLAEFWMIEPEICFAGLEELFVLIEGYIKFCIDYALTNIGDDLEYFNGVYKRNNKQKPDANFADLIEYLKGIRDSPFRRMTYTDAVDYLIGVESRKEHKFDISPYWGLDLSSEHERYICEKLVKGPVFLYNYPREFKAFYMKLNDDKKTVQNTDLLLPFIGEVVGGSVREERLEVLIEKYKDFKLPADDYKEYTDLRRFGSVPHAGFGVGFERLLMLITGIQNIRDVIPFPRYPGHCDC